jgi:hypothetical protein
LVKLGNLKIKRQRLDFVVQRSQYKSILIRVLAGLILGVGAWGLFSLYNKPEFEPIVFSDKKYPGYRKQISNLMNGQTQALSERKVDEASWPYTSASEVEVALVDLNDDHTPEVLALVSSRYYSNAVGGLEFIIYSQSKGRLQPITTEVIFTPVNGKSEPLITGVQTSRAIAKSQHKTNGYWDLAWFVETLHPENDRKHFLVYSNKGHYVYGKSEKITDKERELFNNEKL